MIMKKERNVKTMIKRTLVNIILVATLLIFGTANMANAGKISKKNAQMKMHHLHVMMNKGVLLATQGSNLIMLSKLKMLPSVDGTMAHHGEEMMMQSKPLIQLTMSGPVIMELHNKQYINDPLLHYTEKLSELMIEAIESLEKLNMLSSNSAELMKLRHLQTLMNHALEMAAEGSNLAILGHMSRTGEVMDRQAMEQGSQMMINAKSLVSATLEGEAMKELYAAGVTEDADRMMRQIHSVADSAMKVIDMLIEMPNLK